MAMPFCERHADAHLPAIGTRLHLHPGAWRLVFLFTFLVVLLLPIHTRAQASLPPVRPGVSLDGSAVQPISTRESGMLQILPITPTLTIQPPLPTLPPTRTPTATPTPTPGIGDPDPTFSDPGKVFVPGIAAHDVKVQADGRIVVVGTKGEFPYDFGVIRFLSNGRRDETFGDQGIVGTDLGGYDHANALAIQSDGKLVVAGSTYTDTDDDIAVVRYNTNGSLDATFDGDGIVKTAFRGDDRAYAVAMQPDGKIVVAGTDGLDFALARYTTDGSLDPSFDEDGRVTTDFPFHNFDRALAIAIQPDGKILAGGYAWMKMTGPPYHEAENFALARYNPDGSLDTTFGSGGTVITNAGSPGTGDIITDLVLLPRDKIVVVGRTGIRSGNEDFALARYHPDGSLDREFGTDGIVVTDLTGDGDGDRPFGLVARSSGKLVAAGISGDRLVLVRYHPAGRLDAGFGEGGRVQTDFRNPSYGAGDGAAILQPDGKIVVTAPLGGTALTRHEVDGTLDRGFEDGVGGQAVTGFTRGADVARALALQTDGKIVLAGQAAGRVALARYRADGSLDPAFDHDGRVVLARGPTGGALAVAVQADGKVVAAGYGRSPAGNGTLDFLLVRYAPNGRLDPTFDGDGFVLTDFSVGDDTAYALAIQSDGRILAAGQGSGRVALARYNLDGSLDRSFGNRGKVTSDLAAWPEAAYALLILPDGKILAAGGGNTDYTGSGEFMLVRYNHDGTLDRGFDGDGWTTDASGRRIMDLARSSDGRLVAIRPDDGGSQIARFNPNGSLDRRFGDGGTVTASFSSVTIAVQADGKILAAGNAHSGTDNHVALARYRTNGNLDMSFGDDGKVTTEIGGWSSASSIFLQEDGRIVLAGVVMVGGFAEEFLVARHLNDGHPATTPTRAPTHTPTEAPTHTPAGTATRRPTGSPTRAATTPAATKTATRTPPAGSTATPTPSATMVSPATPGITATRADTATGTPPTTPVTPTPTSTGSSRPAESPTAPATPTGTATAIAPREGNDLYLPLVRR